MDVPGVYDMANCGSELFAAGSAAPNQTAPYFTSANWEFVAPAGTRISRLVTWRYGLSYCCNGWKVAAYDGSANIIGGPFGETCTPPQGFVPCTFGAARRRQQRLAGAVEPRHQPDLVLRRLRRRRDELPDVEQQRGPLRRDARLRHGGDDPRRRRAVADGRRSAADRRLARGRATPRT